MGVNRLTIQAYDAACGGICKSYVDSLTYVFGNLSPISLYNVFNFMPPNGGIIRCKPKVIGVVM
jgi:hypothetical protein